MHNSLKPVNLVRNLTKMQYYNRTKFIYCKTLIIDDY